MIIHVEKTFRAMTGEMCGTYFKEKLKITKHMQKKLYKLFWIPRQRYKSFRYLLQNQKVYLIGSFPSSPTYCLTTSYNNKRQQYHTTQFEIERRSYGQSMTYFRFFSSGGQNNFAGCHFFYVPCKKLTKKWKKMIEINQVVALH